MDSGQNLITWWYLKRYSSKRGIKPANNHKNRQRLRNNTNAPGYLMDLLFSLRTTSSFHHYLLSARTVPVSMELSTRVARPAMLPLSKSCSLLVLPPPKLNQPPDFLALVSAVGAGRRTSWAPSLCGRVSWRNALRSSSSSLKSSNAVAGGFLFPERPLAALSASGLYRLSRCSSRSRQFLVLALK